MRALRRPSLPRSLGAAAGLLLPLAACGGSSTDSSYGGNNNGGQSGSGNAVLSATIEVRDNVFSPSTVLLKAGGTVTWTWVGTDGHSVTPEGSPLLPASAPVSTKPNSLGPVAISAPGTYRYICTAHGSADGYGGYTGMTGTITVQ